MFQCCRFFEPGEEMPAPWKEIAEKRIDSCHFEFPGSTHAIRVRVDGLDGRARKERECCVLNTDETAALGSRSLKFVAKPVEPGENVYVYKKTYYVPEDFDDSRYDPCFSPLVYPGQTVHGSAYIPHYSQAAQVSLYIRDARSGKIYEREGGTGKRRMEGVGISYPEYGRGVDRRNGFLFPCARYAYPGI